MKNILPKINNAKNHIKNSELKKSGHNDYSNYDYFTPEQVDKLVTEASKKENLFNKYDLKRTELGLVAILTIIDMDSFEEMIYEMATDIPEMKATNIAQQLGGAVTYSKRYLLMAAYDIADNSIDFDAQKQKEKKKDDLTPEGKEKKWLNKYDKAGNLLDSYTKTLEAAKSKRFKADDLKLYYKISNITFNEIKKDMV